MRGGDGGGVGDVCGVERVSVRFVVRVDRVVQFCNPLVPFCEDTFAVKHDKHERDDDRGLPPTLDESPHVGRRLRNERQ